MNKSLIWRIGVIIGFIGLMISFPRVEIKTPEDKSHSATAVNYPIFNSVNKNELKTLEPTLANGEIIFCSDCYDSSLYVSVKGKWQAFEYTCTDCEDIDIVTDFSLKVDSNGKDIRGSDDNEKRI